MNLKKCDRCGRTSADLNEKDFLQFKFDFGNFRAYSDFCPSCWGEVGGTVMNMFKREENVAEENDVLTGDVEG